MALSAYHHLAYHDLLKAIGDKVKEGELIASDELHNGHFITNFRAICDGTIVEMVAATIGIKPDYEGAPQHSYPSSLKDEARRTREAFARGRESVKEKE